MFSGEWSEQQKRFELLNALDKLNVSVIQRRIENHFCGFNCLTTLDFSFQEWLCRIRTAKDDILTETISAITRQAIELERCSNDLRIQQVF